MAKKNTVLKTKRLLITPMTEEALTQKIEKTAEPELAAAYGEMLSGCRREPENRLWYTAWQMALKSAPEQPIGDLCFKGAPEKGGVEIGYGTEPGYEGQGYMTEAVKKLTEWALSNTDVYTVFAETAPDNAASQRVLEKTGFVPCTGEGAMGEEGPRFRKDRTMPSYLSIYLCIGLSLGLSLGAALGSAGIGMGLGLCLGVALGILLDRSERKHRREVTGEEPPEESK